MTSNKRIALVGNPNCGKSALFNALTGLRQKVANYPGATVERRTGPLLDNSSVELIDLPGTYSLTPRSPDEEVTRNILMGTQENEAKPEALICVVDATNLAQHLRFTLELKSLGIPMILALNMTDLAAREQIKIDPALLSEKLGIPVIETVAVRKKGLDAIKANIEAILKSDLDVTVDTWDSVAARQKAARKLAKEVTISEGVGHKATHFLDKIFLHPVFGILILFGLLFFMFQAVFSWAEAPMGWIEDGIAILQGLVTANLDEGFITSLLSDGILAGVGSVVVFLPQIIILFAFVLTLESTGYMARAAFLMDKLMASVGLNGRAFIPLLSSFACAIPGIMAARAIADPKDRLTTILIAPLMTCSARLPVYTVIIGAFIPNTNVGDTFVGLQGLVMFGLYLMGIVSALVIAAVLKRTVAKGKSTGFLLELPKYQMPNLRFIMIGLVERSRLFLRRAGTVIMGATIVLWVLASYPGAPAGSDKPDVYHSFAGMIGRALEVIFAPIGFNWEISIALVPGMAAREVAISSLGTVYSLAGSEEAVEAGLVGMLNGLWSLPTALAFLAWFVYAPQCLSTIAVTRRETNGWKWPLFMTGYLFAAAYIAAFITYQLSSALIG
ncbi:ferrous iron transporter B [Kordiimonas sp. SCSIO 12610]|uniref:ferrous iron transporter B n=1 Tax=Kordiimonas sp. SCSIO 12610 TaxID=2829597 RepID=UPI0021089771|nr:ferrous iron transporter B [Kordiimonas sp. SCSIO 12610]UTW54941.1 ferrous iron transporter B [Kordiimonas sp. SCSIO 12610]